MAVAFMEAVVEEGAVLVAAACHVGDSAGAVQRAPCLEAHR
jgi:hypothetical protein